MLPPIWQEPSAARLIGNSRPMSRAAFWMLARMQPASTVIVSLSMSISRMRFSRLVERTISVPSACGWLAPVRPVLPPWGTMGVRVSAQMRTTAASASVLSGRTTAGERPTQPSRQDSMKGCMVPGSVISPRSPTMAWMGASTAVAKSGRPAVRVWLDKKALPGLRFGVTARDRPS